MNIALIGYGKMGKAIEEIAVRRGHAIVLRLDMHNPEEFTRENLRDTDVAIEFTGPESAFGNITRALEYGVPVVAGSTGWLSRWDEVIDACTSREGAFLY